MIFMYPHITAESTAGVLYMTLRYHVQYSIYDMIDKLGVVVSS